MSSFHNHSKRVLQTRVHFMLVAGCHLPMSFWLFTDVGATLSSPQPAQQCLWQLSITVLSTEHLHLHPQSSSVTDLGDVVSSTSQVPTQATCKGNILKIINAHIFLLLRAQLRIPAPSWEFSSSDLCKGSVETPVMGLFSTWDAKSMSLFVTLVSHTSIAEMQMLLQTLLMYTDQTLPSCSK